MAAALQRYAAFADSLPGDVPLKESAEGAYVLFADVEPALKDSARLEWLRPIIDGSDDEAANRRTVALSAGLMAGMEGNELVDFAMTRCPS